MFYPVVKFDKMKLSNSNGIVKILIFLLAEHFSIFLSLSILILNQNYTSRSIISEKKFQESPICNGKNLITLFVIHFIDILNLLLVEKF